MLAIDPVARTLSLSADDDGEIVGAAITVHIPATFDITRYHVGDELELVVTANPDGSYTAVGDSADANAQQADNRGDDGDHGSGRPPAGTTGNPSRHDTTEDPRGNDGPTGPPAGTDLAVDAHVESPGHRGQPRFDTAKSAPVAQRGGADLTAQLLRLVTLQWGRGRTHI